MLNATRGYEDVHDKVPGLTASRVDMRHSPDGRIVRIWVEDSTLYMYFVDGGEYLGDYDSLAATVAWQIRDTSENRIVGKPYTYEEIAVDLAKDLNLLNCSFSRFQVELCHITDERGI